MDTTRALENADLEEMNVRTLDRQVGSSLPGPGYEAKPALDITTLQGEHVVRRSPVKKISPEMRRRRVNFLAERNPVRRILWRLREDSQYLRSAVQFTFLLLCAWIGFEFYLFVQWGQSGGAGAFHSRPPGVEGFLPISSLMSLKYWVEKGIINNIHPSGLFIFLAILAVGMLLKKAFCSWLCPIGTLSESLWRVGQKLFGRNFRITRWLDVPLRSVKYLLLLFFVYAISRMDVESLKEFIYSPYNKVADVKMYLFFADISSFALWTIVALIVLSVFVKNFWCRYLCPYGAFLGLTSLLSPLKITRQASTCIDCELCTRACPSGIKVHSAKQVWSDECTSCLECVAVCPVRNTLDIRTWATAKPVPTWVFGALVTGVFVAVTGLAMLTGHWQNAVSKEEYARRIQQIDSPIYQHFRGQVPKYDAND